MKRCLSITQQRQNGQNYSKMDDIAQK